MSAAMAQKKEGLNGMSENEKLEQAADQAADKPAKTDKKKDVKADKKKPGVFARIGKWFKDMRSELKKVQWPSFKQTMNNTGIVILCVIVEFYAILSLLASVLLLMNAL